MINSARLTQVRSRWEKDKKISADDVSWLLGLGKELQALESVNSMKRPADMLDDLFGGLYGKNKGFFS